MRILLTLTGFLVCVASALANDLVVASTEVNTDADRQRFVDALTEILA